jgi:hypothetical protein
MLQGLRKLTKGLLERCVRWDTDWWRSSSVTPSTSTFGLSPYWEGSAAGQGVPHVLSKATRADSCMVRVEEFYLLRYDAVQTCSALSQKTGFLAVTAVGMLEQHSWSDCCRCEYEQHALSNVTPCCLKDKYSHLWRHRLCPKHRSLLTSDPLHLN